MVRSPRALPNLGQLSLFSCVIKHGITKDQPGTPNLDPPKKAISTHRTSQAGRKGLVPFIEAQTPQTPHTACSSPRVIFSGAATEILTRAFPLLSSLLANHKSLVAHSPSSRTLWPCLLVHGAGEGILSGY